MFLEMFLFWWKANCVFRRGAVVFGGVLLFRSPIKSSWLGNIKSILFNISRLYNLLYASLIVAIGITLGLAIGIFNIW